MVLELIDVVIPTLVAEEAIPLKFVAVIVFVLASKVTLLSTNIGRFPVVPDTNAK